MSSTAIHFPPATAAAGGSRETTGDQARLVEHLIRQCGSQMGPGTVRHSRGAVRDMQPLPVALRAGTGGVVYTKRPDTGAV